MTPAVALTIWAVMTFITVLVLCVLIEEWMNR